MGKRSSGRLAMKVPTFHKKDASFSMDAPLSKDSLPHELSCENFEVDDSGRFVSANRSRCSSKTEKNVAPVKA